MRCQRWSSIAAAPFDLIVEPCFGHHPITRDGVGRQAEDFGSLFHAEPSEVTKFDDFAFPGIEAGEHVQRLMESDYFIGLFIRESLCLIELYLLPSGSSFCAVMESRMIYEDSAHHLRCDSEKMRAALPVHFILVDEPEIGFVHQCRRLKCVIYSLAAKIMGCQAP